MNKRFINQVFSLIDFDRNHSGVLSEIDHYIDTFKISDRDFDDLVSGVIGELFVRKDDLLLADLSREQATSVYEALCTKYG